MNDLIKKIKKARFIWICGNGGSSSTAEHFATDLVKKGYRAIALSSNTSIITMIANDYGYKHIFKFQLERFATKDDLLITISCSGTSPNIVYAMIAARTNGMDVYEFERFGKNRDYGKLEDKHLKLTHEVVAKL